MITQKIYDKVVESYGGFFHPLCLLPKEKIATDVLDESKIHDQIRVLCKSIRQTPAYLKDKKVLEVGSGHGIFVCVTRRDYGMQTEGIEPAEVGFNTSYEIGKEVLDAYNMDRELIQNAKGEHLPFQDNTFDVIFSSNVLEHVDVPIQVLKESLRVLRPGGYMHFVFPNYGAFFDGHYAVFHPPCWLKGRFFPWIIKNIYKRDPAFAKTIRTELNVRSSKRMLKKLSQEYSFEIISLGQDIFEERMRELNFNAYAGLGKIKVILELMKKMRLNVVLMKLFILFKMWDPVIITLKKK